MENFILITGASTGIGEHAASLLIQEGYSVLAGVRSEADGLRLREKNGERLFPILMDVTNEGQVMEAVANANAIIGENQLVAIINNAGIAVSGAVLYIPVEEWQKQFEVNLFGVIRTTQRFFPLLSRNIKSLDHPRRIINMSSISGLFAAPFTGPYSSSKYALEGMSDALRRELYMYDIQVVLIEPANVRTPIWHKAKQNKSHLGPEYETIMAFKEKIIDQNIESGLDLSALNSSLLSAVKDKKVKARYLVVPSKWQFNLVRKVLPTSFLDRIVKKRLQSGSIRPF